MGVGMPAIEEAPATGCSRDGGRGRGWGSERASGGKGEAPGLQPKFIGVGLARIWWEVGAVGK